MDCSSSSAFPHRPGLGLVHASVRFDNATQFFVVETELLGDRGRLQQLPAVPVVWSGAAQFVAEGAKVVIGMFRTKPARLADELDTAGLTVMSRLRMPAVGGPPSGSVSSICTTMQAWWVLLDRLPDAGRRMAQDYRHSSERLFQKLQARCRVMIPRGTSSVVSMSSTAASWAEWALTLLAKHALSAWLGVAAELGQYGIRANCMARLAWRRRWWQHSPVTPVTLQAPRRISR